jgi:nitrite reductase/ring-hydroxylating ferredoxin subunit
MQSFDTESDQPKPDRRSEHLFVVGPIEDLPEGSCKTLELPEGHQIAVFNVDGEFCAINNFCPHKGAPLAEGILTDGVVECEWHGWRFDVRTGECLTVAERIETYDVVVEEGIVAVRGAAR